MTSEARVNVRERTADEDVVDWVENVMGEAISKDHFARSPLCRATQMEYAKIPAPENASFIGGKPKLDS